MDYERRMRTGLEVFNRRGAMNEVLLSGGTATGYAKWQATRDEIRRKRARLTCGRLRGKSRGAERLQAGNGRRPSSSCAGNRIILS